MESNSSAKFFLKEVINDFSTDKLIRFLREKSRKFRSVGDDLNQYDNEDFSEGKMLGEIGLEDNSQLLICAFKVNKELTERSGKKAQYILGKKILKETARYAAGFFIFYDENTNFRFSLIYDIPKPGAKRDWSSFRRYTYFVSKELTNKTFLNQMDAADFTSLKNIIDAFSVEKVTKEFYQEIANWYFWAVKNVKFPRDAENETNGRNIAVIRLITRLIFIWFMKAKGLIGNHLFKPDDLNEYLKNFEPESEDSDYYKAILQNLFFATLNTRIEKRKFRREDTFQGKNKDYMEHDYYRYHSLFKNPKDMLDIFKGIPFLNGGLFECLDKRKDDPTNETGEEIRIDGFSDKETKQPVVPNFLFFSDEQKVDLQKDYGVAKYKNAKVKGIINILQSYNFTIDENTPADEEVALDPELLGKVFENLLAAYNPETATTARKTTGSYYTPREIVNYMVDESLIAFLKHMMIEGAKSYIELGTDQEDMFGNTARKGQLKIEEELLPSRWIDNEDKLEEELRKLISYEDHPVPFTEKETDILINAINNCKILDPAVGSGAFPMGVLHKLVLILSKLDPHNIKWKQQQISAIESNVTDPGLKKVLIKKIEDNFNRNELDYGRKLYLIQNCLYGVDIQPIAIQIAKLRFFISLLVDEKIISPLSLARRGDGDEVDNFGIEPLPNLETKLVAANTLIGLKRDSTLKPDELEDLEDKLFELRQKYFTSSDEKEKKKIEKKDRTLRQKIKKVLEKNGLPAEYSEKIAGWDPYDTNKSSGWFDPEWMFGVKDGFDIAIANPPYINIENLDESIKKMLYSEYNSCKGRTDIYITFIDRSINLLRNSGVLSFIVPYAFTNQKYGTFIRKKIIDKYFIREIVDTSNFFVFESAMVKNIIMIITKRKSQGYTKIRNVNSFDSFIKSHLKTHYLNQELYLKLKDYRFETKPIVHKLKIKEKMLIDTVPFIDICFIAYGVRINHKSKNIKKEYYIHKNYKENYKPFLEGKNIKRYYHISDSWLDYRPNEHYNPMFPELFENDKIIFINVVKDKLRFSFDIQKIYNSHTVINCVLWHLLKNVSHSSVIRNISKERIANSYNYNYKYLLAILNSNLMNWYFCNFLSEKLHFYPDDAKQLPIRILNNLNQKPFIKIVDEILKIKIKNPEADTNKLEFQIDLMVYKLYNLTYEEVKVVDPGFALTKEEHERFEIK